MRNDACKFMRSSNSAGSFEDSGESWLIVVSALDIDLLEAGKIGVEFFAEENI